MNILWPASLPCRPMLGFDESPKMPKASFDSDTGPAIERPKGTIRISDTNVTFKMTTEQVATFEDFVQNDLKQGSRPFYMTHPRRLVQVKVRILGDQPYKLTEMAPSIWSVSMNMTVVG